MQEGQLNIVSELVEDAKQRGGTIHTGGERMDMPGYFYPPTIVTGLDNGDPLVGQSNSSFSW